MSLSGKSSGGGSGTTTTTTSSQPPEFQKPFLEYGMGEAKNLYQSDKPNFFPNSTVVPFSNQTQQALGMQEQRASMGSPLNTGAQIEALRNLSGQYLNQENPAYAGMVERSIAPMRQEFQNTVMPGITSRFANAGRSNSGIAETAARQAAGDTYMRGVGDITSGLAYKNYGDERARMQEAMRQAPGLAQTDYTDIAQLGQVGAIREDKAGQELQDQISRFNFDQNIGDEKLRRYMTLVGGGNYGGTSAATAPTVGNNPWLVGAGLLGTAAGAAGSLFGRGGVFPNAFA